MTLKRFRRLTARTDEGTLRHAMTLALRVEVPHSAEEYERFYDRVVDAVRRSEVPPRARAREAAAA